MNRRRLAVRVWRSGRIAIAAATIVFTLSVDGYWGAANRAGAGEPSMKGMHMKGMHMKEHGASFFPKGAAAKVVTVSATGEAQASINVMTEAIALKKHGPKAVVDKFGEIYSFNPAFLAVHRDQPTQIEFWNLQTDDDHDFALMGSDLKVLTYLNLPALEKTAYIFTFHKEGVFDFKCLHHQPEMSGQVLVLPPDGP